MSNLFYPEMLHADLEMSPIYSTEVVEYETGQTQRNALWIAPAVEISLRYGILSEVEYRALYNFWSQHRGAYEPFWFTDYTERNPTGKMIAFGDGATTEFKMPVDAMDALPAPVIYEDAVAFPAAVVDTTTGVVTFPAAPAAGVVITFDATNARYRVRFARDELPSERHKFIHWGSEVRLVQVKFT